VFVLTECFCAEALWELCSHLLKHLHSLQLRPFPLITELLNQILINILKSRNIPVILLKTRVDICIQNKILIKSKSKLSKLAEINKGVHQCCPLSPTQCNIRLGEIITKWQKTDITGIPLSKNKLLLTSLFADDQVIIFKTEDNLQKATYKLNHNRT
jgi:hypothetical protein